VRPKNLLREGTVHCEEAATVLDCVAAHARANKEAMKATYTFTVLRSQYGSRPWIGSKYRIGVHRREVSQTELLGAVDHRQEPVIFSLPRSQFEL